MKFVSPIEIGCRQKHRKPTKTHQGELLFFTTSVKLNYGTPKLQLKRLKRSKQLLRTTPAKEKLAPMRETTASATAPLLQAPPPCTSCSKKLMQQSERIANSETNPFETCVVHIQQIPNTNGKHCQDETASPKTRTDT